MTRNQEIETAILQRQAARLVEREVQCCMSSLVATLAKGAHFNMVAADLSELTEQAMELAAPVLVYEAPLLENGWRREPNAEGVAVWKHQEDIGPDGHVDAVSACEEAELDPYEVEVFEHWAVSSWLAEKLIGKGERVDTDFAGLNVWARTTTGQAIGADSVIEAIVAETGYASAV